MANRSGAKKDNAIALLTADHTAVKKLFKEFEKLFNSGEEDEAQAVAKRICNELTVHTTIEEEIFYPVARAAIGEEDMLDEAEVEHATAKDLISQIESMKPQDDKYAAKVCVLGEYIDHHVKEEHTEMFPKVKKASVDLVALGEKMRLRKQELMAEMGVVEGADAHLQKSAGHGSSRTRAIH